jgi:flagellar biosynthetic protein FliP
MPSRLALALALGLLAAPAASAAPAAGAAVEQASPAAEPVSAQGSGMLGAALSDLDALASDPTRLTPAFRLAILVTLLSLAPALVMMLTCFVRIVIVLTLLRQALGVLNAPPTQVLVSLALFLTLFVMQPAFDQAYSAGIGPFLRGELSNEVAFENTVSPLRSYMLGQTREEDLLLFEEISRRPLPEQPSELSLSILVPAFMLSELRTAFLIGFMLFLPFLVIDMVVASTLLSMGMIVVPPVMISLPLKLMVFVLVDGWNLIVGALVRGIAT